MIPVRFKSAQVCGINAHIPIGTINFLFLVAFRLIGGRKTAPKGCPIVKERSD